MAFWTDTSVEPKRNYRFRISIGGTAEQFGSIWYAKKADKPKFTQDATTHEYLNHQFKFPGRIKWEDVTVELVDPVTIDAAAITLGMIEASGYRVPQGSKNAADAQTMSKKEAVGALSSVIIEQLDDKGNPIETWKLQNAWLVKAEFSALDYSTEEMSTITLTLAYDWASCDAKSSGGFFGGGRTA